MGPVVRVLLGFVAYGVLVTIWLWLGVDQAYDDLVLSAAAALVPLLTHFPIGSSELSPVTLHNQGYVIVLGLSMALVVGGMSWPLRVKRYGLILATIFAAHVLAMALQLHLGLALKFQENAGVPLLVDWELQAIRTGFQVLFLFGLQVAAFVLIVATAAWSAGDRWTAWFGATTERRRPKQGRRRVALAAVGALAVTIVACGVGWWVRERSPEHVAAHVHVGHAFLDQGMTEQAERQYRAAIRGGTRDGRTWLNLIALTRQRGRSDEARRLTREAERVVTDPAWRGRFSP